MQFLIATPQGNSVTYLEKRHTVADTAIPASGLRAVKNMYTEVCGLCMVIM